jgi:hypothetical protein
MFKITITKQGIQTHGAKFPTQAEADVWIADNVANNSWGFPERWVKQSDLTLLGLSPANSVAVEERTTELGSALYFKFPSDYTVEVSDATAEVLAEQEEQESVEAFALVEVLKNKIRTINLRKLKANTWDNAKWAQFKNDANINSARLSINDASLKDAKAAIQAVSTDFYTAEEKADIIALIDAHTTKWGY